MPEHTPAPLPDRSVYGFVMYLGTYTLLGVYLVWAFIPDEWLHAVGLTYWPQKYWALAVPVYLVCALLTYVYLILPGLSFLSTASFDSTDTFQDKHTRRCPRDVPYGAIPPMSDIHISEVCRTLYLNNETQ